MLVDFFEDVYLTLDVVTVDEEVIGVVLWIWVVTPSKQEQPLETRVIEHAFRYDGSGGWTVLSLSSVTCSNKNGICAYRVTARYSEQKEAPISRRRRALRHLSELHPAEAKVARTPTKMVIAYISSEESSHKSDEKAYYQLKFCEFS